MLGMRRSRGAGGRRRAAWAVASVLSTGAVAGWAADDGGPAVLADQQVTATRMPRAILETPAAVSVITGDELRARGANSLRTALNGIAGVEISPGGEAGPAGAVPAFWGLREFDAFLLVVDGVPWGGAFNPALTSLDLHNVERIEVMRGAAPVMYGATSFVGVIRVIHYAAGQAERRVHGAFGGVAGNPGNVAVSASEVLGPLGGWRQSLAADVARKRYADAAAGLERGHLAYRTAGELLGGHSGVDVDLQLLRQSPQSPYPRAGNGLDPSVDTDANFNPSDARLDEDRLQVVLRHDRDTAWGRWRSVASLSHRSDDIVRGFVAEGCEGGVDPADSGDNACGFVQDRTLSNVYLDSHLETELGSRAALIWGADALLGVGEQESAIFTYTVDPRRGGDAPSSGSRPVVKQTELEDERQFYGLYGQLEWQPRPSVSVFAGLRLNATEEQRDGEEETAAGEEVPAGDHRRQTRLSGAVGAAWTVWRGGPDSVALYADVRDTYKPAALDFGPDAEAQILEPETARSYEAGIKTRALGGRLSLDANLFYMNMDNLVVPQIVDGTPGLGNAGTLFFKGGEIEARYRLGAVTRLYAAYARHDLRFGDYERLFDGEPTQLRGNFQELAPRHVASVGAWHAPDTGLQWAANAAYTGTRYLNKRNTSKADAYTVFDAMLGYRFHGWGVSLVGTNLGDARDPVSESELGDGQYYRMPARSVEVDLSFDL
ncbi:MAG: TonB-dependent receptor [Nevskiales bacterium]|nr:TonB-dependent receptor [Nevskiales bacterium]